MLDLKSFSTSLSSPGVVDWSEFHVWSYRKHDIYKHSRMATDSCGGLDHIPCSACLASRGLFRETLTKCIELFRNRDTALLAGKSAETVYVQFAAGALGNY